MMTQTEVTEMQEKRRDDELISKFSTDQLICKTPQESPNTSVKSLKSDKIKEKKEINNYLLQLGGIQILLGMLMLAFGILVIVNNARMAQIGAGVWGGCLAVVSGTSGVMAAARSWCPLKGSAQKVAHTTFLALSLIGIAISQLVLVLASTGLARELYQTDTEYKITDEVSAHKTNEHESLQTTAYEPLLYNSCLIIVSALECVCSVIASYKSARDLCPCFQNQNVSDRKLSQNSKDALVNSWLGKHTISPSLYVVAAQPKSRPGHKWKTDPYAIAPVVRLQHHTLLPPPPVIGYPLIPAPLGPVPSPIIPMHSKNVVRQKHKLCHSGKRRMHKERQKKPYLKPKKKITPEIDVVQTYTGLDRVIAEEFIDICDSRNNSLCSSCSCQSNGCKGCSCTGNSCDACTNVCNNINCNYSNTNQQ